MRIAVINGPNLNLLGVREPEVYGTDTLAEIESAVRDGLPDIDLEFFQSNHEGAIVDELHSAGFQRGCDGVVLNPGAFTHYSIAIRDAIAALHVPVVELHLTNTQAREEFRRHSVIAPVCQARVEGFGVVGYVLAIRGLQELIARG